MNSLIRLIVLPFIPFFCGVSNLHSQPGKLSRNIISSKDVFGTRVLVENKNQFNTVLKTDDKVYYAFENGQEKIYFTNKGLVYKQVKKQRITHEMHEAIERGEKIELKPDEFYFVKMTWENANSDIKIEEGLKQSHYFTYGGPELNANTFKKITYKNIYTGIDFEYTIPENKDHGIKYSVIVHPGANPNDIKMVYTGDIKKLSSNASGDVIIKTPLESITEHAPLTFYRNKKVVASSFKINKNTLSFNFPDGYDNTQTLIIDPWITVISTLSATNFGFDVDYDFAGNIFVYGGNEPFKLAMFNPAGILQWTFGGTVTTPVNWSTGAYPGNFVVNKTNGKSFIGQGYISGGTSTIRLSNTGNFDNFITTPNPNWNECWDMGFHCATGNIYAFGGGQSGNLSAGIINQNTATVSTTAFFPSNPLHGQDVASHAIDYVGNVFVYFSQGMDSAYFLNNKIVLLNPSLTGVIWNKPSSYHTLYECKNKAAYVGSGIMNPNSNSSNGFNCLAVNSDYLYFYDGFNLAAYDKTNGSKIGCTTIAGLIAKEQGGIAVDDCNNIYVGGKGNILSYHFKDSVFTAVASAPIDDTTTNKYVYDIRLDKTNGLLYVSGSGFIATYDAILCSKGTSTANNLKVCKGGILKLNTALSPSYSWSGPAGFSSDIQNPFLINVTPSMAGAYNVITPTGFCSSTTLSTINVTIDSISVSITANPNIGFAPLNVEFNNVMILQNVNSGIMTHKWNYGNGISMNNSGTTASFMNNLIPNGNTIYQSAGSYPVHLTVTQTTGTLVCVASASTLVKVESPSNIKIPNTFTPNGDGINDSFFFQTTNLTEITCLIYDRWGVKMYDGTSDKGNIKWDGKNLSNKEVPDGTYFYIIKAKGLDDKEYEHKGTISLFR